MRGALRPSAAGTGYRMPAGFIRKIRSAWRLPLREKTWLLLVFPLSGAIRAALLCLPFRLVARYLGKHHGNRLLSPLADAGQIGLARRIARLSERASRHTPWKSECLVQAIMVKTLLSHYRIPYAIHLGVAHPAAGKAGPGEGLKAHAWVVVGPRVVAGAQGHQAYTVVSTFVNPALLAEQGSPAGFPPASR